jgi:hypothetical protein
LVGYELVSVIFFTFLSLRLSQSHVPNYRFNRLTWVDSNLFLLSFFIYLICQFFINFVYLLLLFFKKNIIRLAEVIKLGWLNNRILYFFFNPKFNMKFFFNLKKKKKDHPRYRKGHLSNIYYTTQQSSGKFNGLSEVIKLIIITLIKSHFPNNINNTLRIIEEVLRSPKSLSLLLIAWSIIP